jgi:hypothetical protein
MRGYNLISSAVVSATVFACACLATAAPKPNQRTGEKPCREGVLGIVSMLDAKTDDTDDYRHTYSAIVETCGPPSMVRKSGGRFSDKAMLQQNAPAPKLKDPPPSRAGCRDLAMAMVDLIEDGKMNTKAFVKARDDFAGTCPPR